MGKGAIWIEITPLRSIKDLRALEDQKVAVDVSVSAHNLGKRNGGYL